MDIKEKEQEEDKGNQEGVVLHVLLTAQCKMHWTCAVTSYQPPCPLPRRGYYHPPPSPRSTPNTYTYTDPNTALPLTIPLLLCHRPPGLVPRDRPRPSAR